LSVAGLTLRPWEHADAPSLVRAYEDPDIHRWHSRSMSLTEAQPWVAYELDRWERGRLGDRPCWIVAGRIAIGSLALGRGSGRSFVLGYPGVPRSGRRHACPWRHADWAFDEVGFHRLELDHSTSNAASCRVATKAGFVPEGTKRSQALHLDGWHDMHADGLVAHDARPRGRDVGAVPLHQRSGPPVADRASASHGSMRPARMA
jgi:RimJ/RimL family protein N-acetyltransferase